LKLKDILGKIKVILSHLNK
uniref:Bombolitin-7 n=1 Tax=Bombus lapidarius TaxID=30192 RepID=BOL7_BOMLA|nr:RecName: Full=Bombolitin-7 [Bombus lapidarius]